MGGLQKDLKNGAPTPIIFGRVWGLSWCFNTHHNQGNAHENFQLNKDIS